MIYNSLNLEKLENEIKEKNYNHSRINNIITTDEFFNNSSNEIQSSDDNSGCCCYYNNYFVNKTKINCSTNICQIEFEKLRSSKDVKYCLTDVESYTSKDLIPKVRKKKKNIFKNNKKKYLNKKKKIINIKYEIRHRKLKRKFRNKDKFVSYIKRKFGTNLSDKNRERIYNFKNLKLFLLNFIFEDNLSEIKYEELSLYEQLILEKMVMKISQKNWIYKDFGFNELKKLAKKRQEISEKNKLKMIICLLFKIIMWKFKYNTIYSEKLLKGESSLMKNDKMDKEKTKEFYISFFKDVASKNGIDISEFYLTKEIFNSVESIEKYLEILKLSPKLMIEMKDLIYKKNTQKICEVEKVFKFETVDKISKRINNFEIVLNQYEEPQKESIREWLTIILLDLELNPNVIIPRKMSVFRDSLDLLKVILTKNHQNN